MLAYRSASNTCSETTNMVYGLSRFLSLATGAQSEANKIKVSRHRFSWLRPFCQKNQKPSTSFTPTGSFWTYKIHPKTEPRKIKTPYLWPRSKVWMRAHKRTFKPPRLKSQIGSLYLSGFVPLNSIHQKKSRTISRVMS